MTISLELTPETEARLNAHAKRRGISVENLLKNTIEILLASSEELPVSLSPHERAERFVNWAKRHSRKAPPLSDEAISRENIYREREDSQR